MQVTETLQPFAEAFPSLADAEERVYKILVALRCAPWLPTYAQVHSRLDCRQRACWVLVKGAGGPVFCPPCLFWGFWGVTWHMP